MPASETSKAITGGGSLRMDVNRSAKWAARVMSGLDERHFVDFPQRGDALADLLHSRFAQERHAFFAGQALDFGSGALVQNHFADAVGQVEQLMDGGAAAEPGAAALKAPGAFHK